MEPKTFTELLPLVHEINGPTVADVMRENKILRAEIERLRALLVNGAQVSPFDVTVKTDPNMKPGEWRLEGGTK